MKDRKPPPPPDCVGRLRKNALHYLDGGPAGEILCGTPVSLEAFMGKPYTQDVNSVTCWECVQILMARGTSVRNHKGVGK